MTISAARRRQTEDSIRTAIDRLLRGQIPAGAGCDVKTLAQEAGVSRAALYRSYGHLTEEFERRLTQMRAEGHLPDLKSVQIVRLKDENNEFVYTYLSQPGVKGQAIFQCPLAPGRRRVERHDF